MTAAPELRDWTASFARRTQALGGGEITAILALAGATDVITFSGGFPDPETFPSDVLGEIARRLLAEDAAVALQYAPSEGLEGLRDYLSGRIGSLQGERPGPGELMITSGGIDCLELVAKSLVDPGDAAVVEAPSYLGAIMAFRGYEADLRGVPMDGGGMRVDVLEDMLAAGLRPKVLYTIPDHQNPTGLSLAADRRPALVDLARRYRFLILEDVAYRELGFAELAPRRGVEGGLPPLGQTQFVELAPQAVAEGGSSPVSLGLAQLGAAAPPTLWSIAPDVVIQAGTFSKTFFPGVRLGWAAGPPEVIAQLVVAKQNSDQCAGALGQRMLEEYGRGGYLDRQLVASRALYERRAGVMGRALAEHMPDGTSWTTPRGGFFTWLTTPDGVDTVALSPAARARKVAYVPGRPFYPGDGGTAQMRLAYSRVADHLIDEGARRLGGLVRTALEGK